QAEAEPSQAPTRRRQSTPESEAGSVDSGDDGEADLDTQAASQDQMVKNLIRLSLATNMRVDTVMPPGTARRLPHVLSATNAQLRSVFGMELTELPQKEKITVSQKRAAQRSAAQSQQGGGSASSSVNKAYILTNTLPARYRIPKILPPAGIPSAGAEGAYMGLVTFVLGLIYLSPAATLSENRLEKHLKRMNADEYVLGGERKDNVLKRMIKEGYIIRVRERDQGGEETVDFVVGPRGKVEVGERGVAGLIRTVYGKKDAEADELERRLVRSLGDVVIQKRRRREAEGGEQGRGEGEEGEEVGDEPTRNGLVDGETEKADRGTTRRLSSAKGMRARDGEEEDEEEDEEEIEEEEEMEEDEDDEG
ncbi:MAG: hypothetical protein Q9217_006196, partial [Psora testacea]